MAVDDAYTKCLLHFDGSDGSTTFTDEAGNTFTASGNAQIDTAQNKFGGASGLFDGDGDYISAPDSDDWRLDDGDNANQWTIDFWIRFNGDPGSNNVILLTQLQNAANQWRMQLSAGSDLNFRVRSGGTNIVSISKTWNPEGDTWYHVAVVKDGSNGYMMFVDGTQIGATETDVSTIPDFSGVLQAGYGLLDAGTNSYFSGWIDELRISKGVARWTSNFTPPSAAYGPAVSGGRRFRAMMVG